MVGERPRLREFRRSAADQLRKRRWQLLSLESEAEWTDLWLCVPLATLLVAEDQQKAVCEFVAAALNDLKELGVMDAFNRTIGCGVSAKGK